jgi:hypothetical protein
MRKDTKYFIPVPVLTQNHKLNEDKLNNFNYYVEILTFIEHSQHQSYPTYNQM